MTHWEGHVVPAIPIVDGLKKNNIGGFSMKGIVTEIIDNETIKVSPIHEDAVRILKGDEFYISGLKDIFDDEESESEGIVFVNFNEETNVIIESFEEGDL